MIDAPPPAAPAARDFPQDAPVESVQAFLEALLDGTCPSPGAAAAARRALEAAGDRDKLPVLVVGALSGARARRLLELARLYPAQPGVELLDLRPGTAPPWKRIQASGLPWRQLGAEDTGGFLRAAALAVAARPVACVHLAGLTPRAVLVGALCKLIWGAAVLLDLEDHPAPPDRPVRNRPGQEAQEQDAPVPDEAAWSQACMELLPCFDALTVATPALQAALGGHLVRSPAQAPRARPLPRDEARQRLGIPPGAPAVLLLVGPEHRKDILGIATALAAAGGGGPQPVLAVSGELPADAAQALPGVPGLTLVGPEMVDRGPLAERLPAFDLSIVAQSSRASASSWLLPPRMLDALQGPPPVLTTPGEAVQDLLEAGAVVATGESLQETLRQCLRGEADLAGVRERAASYREAHFSEAAARAALEAAAGRAAPGRRELAAPLKQALSRAGWGGLTEPLEALATASEPDAAAQPAPEAPPAAQRLLPLSVLVITWDIGHNPLGRSYMLAEVLQRTTRHCVLAGFRFSRYGAQVWEPVRNGRIPVVDLGGGELPEFADALARLAPRIRPDVVIACKPRLPSLLLGLLVKRQWGCPLLVDVDDHELAFFPNQAAVALEDLQALAAGALADRREPYGAFWTGLAHSLLPAADELLVSNPALQREFGGTLLPHARDESVFLPERFDRAALRARHRVPADAKVVLFFGTARAHKGLARLAEAVGRLEDPRALLLLVGEFASAGASLSELRASAGGRLRRLGRQPFDAVPEILAMADLVCLPQDEEHPVSRYQLPAKAIDAIAMGVPLLVSRTPPLLRLVEEGLASALDPGDMAASLAAALDGAGRDRASEAAARARFLEHYSHAALSRTLRQLLSRVTKRGAAPLPFDADELLAAIRRTTGAAAAPAPATDRRGEGRDVVLFWKRNDTGLYGRRHDMVIHYLASRADVRKVLVFDAAVSGQVLARKALEGGEHTQFRQVYLRSHARQLGLSDEPGISFNVFIHPSGRYRRSSGEDERSDKPELMDDYLPWIEQVLRREGVEAARSVFWIYPHNPHLPRLVRHFSPLVTVADLVDDDRLGATLTPQGRQAVEATYRETLALADFAFANCEPVRESMQAFFPAVRLVPNACDPAPPCVAPAGSAAYEALQAWKGPVLGFVGNLEAKMDLVLLDRLARELPDCLLALVGSTHINPAALELRRHANVLMPGVVPYEEAGAWVSRFDVGLVPHLDTPQTRSMNPLKVFVYIAWQLPVVATAVSNVDAPAGLVRVAPTHDGFIAAVRAALAEGRPDPALAAAYVAANSWEARLRAPVDEVMALAGARAGAG